MRDGDGDADTASANTANDTDTASDDGGREGDHTAVGVLLYDGFDELDAIGPYEVVCNAAAAGGGIDATLYALGDAATVTASHGLRVEPEATLPAPTDGDAPDLLIVPGGGWSDGSTPGVRTEYESGAIPEAVRAHHDAGGTVAAVCTGAMLLSKAGLLDGRPAATHASAREDLAATDAVVVAERVVDDGDVLTAGGVTSGLDLALHLVERYAGADVARVVAETIEYERRFETHEG